MNTVTIRKIYFIPPIAVARVGDSAMPLEAFTWGEDMRSFGAGKTVIVPAVSLEVLADGSVEPYRSQHIRFKDNGAIRPVCPFLELHATYEEKERSLDAPLTPSLLKRAGLSLSSLSFVVRAANRKAARRTGSNDCAFEACDQIPGNDHSRHELNAYTHGKFDAPLVSPKKPIPLGSFQVIRPADKDARRLDVQLDTIRVRFTPGRGQVFGPPDATDGLTNDNRKRHTIVPPQNRFLNPKSSWIRYDKEAGIPGAYLGETFDGDEDIDSNGVSRGVVDDTCDVLITAQLTDQMANIMAGSARIIVGPPDFAPDIRPFYSLADDLADRDPDSVPNLAKETPDRLRDAVVDLFRRIFETASVINVDRQRTRSLEVNLQLYKLTDQNNPHGFPSVGTHSMTPKDKIKGKPLLSELPQGLNLDASMDDRRDDPELPRSDMAREKHQNLADVESLIQFLIQHRTRLHQIIRPPYAAFSELPSIAQPPTDPMSFRDPRVPRDKAWDMRMPPYMRDSDLTALSLTKRQWNMLFRYVDVLWEESHRGRRMPESSPAQQHSQNVKSRNGSKPHSGPEHER